MPPRVTTPTTAPTTTTRATTTTTQDPRCPAGQHYDDHTSGCHSNHDRPACHNNYEHTYDVHDPSERDGHITAVVTECGTNTELPPNPPTCPAGQHYHNLPDACHQHDTNPPCHPSRYVSYLRHISNPNDHFYAVRYPCPTHDHHYHHYDHASDNCTPTTAAPITTSTSGVLICGAIPQSELDRVKDATDGTPTSTTPPPCWRAPPCRREAEPAACSSPPTRRTLLVRPSRTYGRCSILALIGGRWGGCVWESMEVRSVWRELYIWNAADRLLIGRVVPSFVTRWNNLSVTQQDILRNGHSHISPHRATGPMSTLDPEDDCAFYLPHPMVYAWQLQVRFETNSEGSPRSHGRPSIRGPRIW